MTITNANLQIIEGIHPQSGKPTAVIVICGEGFVYSDKRGYGMNSIISKDFARKIMDTFQGATGSTGLPVYYPYRLVNEQVKLSWVKFDHTGQYVLKIHAPEHVWSSAPIGSETVTELQEWLKRYEEEEGYEQCARIKEMIEQQ